MTPNDPRAPAAIGREGAVAVKFGSLFSGIGGMDLGFERAGMKCAWQVEIDEYATKVLTKHWPDVPKYGDIRDVGKENLETVDLICGGFPCQPFSVAGKQKGEEDDRHLWPEMLRVISELKPAWVLGENVPGIIPIFLDQAIDDLEAEGYTCEAFVLPAYAVDAPHQRYRLFIVAYSERVRCLQREKPTSGQQWTAAQRESDSRCIQPSSVSNPNSKGLEEWSRENTSGEGQNNGAEFGRDARWLPEPGVGRVAHGVPNRVDRLRGLGNAVVPQVAEFIGEIIMTANLDGLPMFEVTQ